MTLNNFKNKVIGIIYEHESEHFGNIENQKDKLKATNHMKSIIKEIEVLYEKTKLSRT